MDINQRRRLIAVAAGREPADLAITNCQIVDVFRAEIFSGAILIADDRIAAVLRTDADTDADSIAEAGETVAGIAESVKSAAGVYGTDNITAAIKSAASLYDAGGAYVAPGLIDSHIHIESSFVTPEEFGRLVVPHGTTTVIADPHEIANVGGLPALRYMIRAANRTALDIKYMLPSCVPPSPHEESGARLDADDLAVLADDPAILGLGEFMDYPGVINTHPNVMAKLDLAHSRGMTVDGHSPGVAGRDLDAYAAAGISTDHECSTQSEMLDRLSRGMYVLLRHGSATLDLANLVGAVTPLNSRRCLICSDDRQPRTILEKGHLEEHLRLCVAGGLDPVVALQMASLNAAECYGLNDRGAICPGRRADLVLFDNLIDFTVAATFIRGRRVAERGRYLPQFEREPIAPVASSIRVRDFSVKRLALPLKSATAKVIDILPGGVVTGKGTATVSRDEAGRFVYSPDSDIVKIAVVERHRNTGRVGLGLLRGYGIRRGAVAFSVAHDTHNIIVAGVNDADMALAVETLIDQGGGAALTLDGKVIGSLPLPVAGLMSDRTGDWVAAHLDELFDLAVNRLGISPDVDPLLTLGFMSLTVIPELKITDRGLFDVAAFKHTGIDAN